MLVQSNENEIRLLPALPDAWAEGAVKGICARSGYVVSIDWSNKTIKKMSISAKNNGRTTLYYGKEKKEITLKKGQTMELGW